MNEKLDRRDFVRSAGTAAAGALLSSQVVPARVTALGRRRYAIVGTGHRATGMWGKDIADRYKDEIEFVGLCDKNPLRVEAGRKLIGVECPTFTNFDEMLDRTKPELVMVTTVDSTHHTFRLREVIFRNASVPDYLKFPSARAGAMSCMTGIAARTSIERSRPVKIRELIKL